MTSYPFSAASAAQMPIVDPGPATMRPSLSGPILNGSPSSQAEKVYAKNLPSSRFSALRAGSRANDRELLYKEFTPLVKRLIRQYGSDPEFREDLAGEIYCRFCDLLDAYDPSRGIPLRPYLVRQLTASVYTLARQQWRHQRREIYLDAETIPQEAFKTPDPTPQWDQALTMEQTLKTLPEAIRQLPKRQQQVVIWRYYESRSFEEIAALLDVKLATARSLLRHGINNLRRQLAGTCFDFEG